MVNTTCKFFITCCVNQWYNSSAVSSMRPSRWEASLQWVIRVLKSSPSNRPGTFRNARNKHYAAQMLYTLVMFTYFSIGKQCVDSFQEA